MSNPTVTETSAPPLASLADAAARERSIQATVSAPMAALIEAVDEALGCTSAEGLALARLPEIVREYLAEPRLLTAEQRVFDRKGYARHLVHADPHGRFSVLAIAWLPGQVTPVHGHNPWGVVGVYGGIMENTCYRVRSGSRDSGGVTAGEPSGTQRASAGTVVTIASGDVSAHCLRNPGPAGAYTLHIYGMDLAAQPLGVNRYYD